MAWSQIQNDRKNLEWATSRFLSPEESNVIIDRLRQYATNNNYHWCRVRRWPWIGSLGQCVSPWSSRPWISYRKSTHPPFRCLEWSPLPKQQEKRQHQYVEIGNFNFVLQRSRIFFSYFETYMGSNMDPNSETQGPKWTLRSCFLQSFSNAYF